MQLPAAAGPPTESAATPGGKVVIVGELRGAITPITVQYVRKCLARSAETGAALVVFEMDTPGGLVASTEEIIQAILASRAPVAILVAPGGAQAASAGLYISNAADVIAMAPGTRIGAGHPVGVSGTSPGGGDKEQGRDYMGEKIENDLAAGVRSIATNRGRNAEVYEKMVRDSISLTEREALDQKVIDLVARGLDELMEALEGSEIKRFDGSVQVLALAPARLTRFEMNAWQRILSFVADPNIAFILLGIGMLGLYVEFNNPGLIAPGIVGGVALILFAMSVQILPIKVVGLLLLALAAALFVLEIKFASYGLLSVGGVLAMTLGFMTLFDADQMPTLKVSLVSILPTSLAAGLLMIGITALALKAQRTRVSTGMEGLKGEIGDAMTEIGPSPAGVGKVFVHGEYWNAVAREPIARGGRVRIKAVREMTLDVEPVDR